MPDWFATLSMYDWPEVRNGTDCLWRAIAAALADHGVLDKGNVPAHLARDRDAFDAWLDRHLAIGQTCGLPYATRLKEGVMLLGSAVHGIEAPAGCYHSVIIAGQGDDDIDPCGTRGLRLAYNDGLSQSGVAAWLGLLDREGRGLPEELHPVRTRAHRESIRAVGEGRADLASIDAVSFALALRHEPAASRVRVIARSPDFPSLPYIASRALADRRHAMQVAMRDAIASLPQDVRNALLIDGFVMREPADYAPLATAWQDFSARGWLVPFA